MATYWLELHSTLVLQLVGTSVRVTYVTNLADKRFFPGQLSEPATLQLPTETTSSWTSRIHQVHTVTTLQHHDSLVV